MPEISVPCPCCGQLLLRVNDDGVPTADSPPFNDDEHGKYSVCGNPTCRRKIRMVQPVRGVWLPARNRIAAAARSDEAGRVARMSDKACARGRRLSNMLYGDDGLGARSGGRFPLAKPYRFANHHAQTLSELQGILVRIHLLRELDAPS